MNTESTAPESLLKSLAKSLLALRLGVFIVMLMWTLDKFFNPAHAGKVFDKFFGISWLSENLAYVVGFAELLLVLAFVAGIWKRWTYGAIFLLHAISTFSSYKQYLAPFDHLLFFAAWPMLAACFVLYFLRDWDTLGTVPSKAKL
tara:strand:+ start:326 stop:760 length:435 start_codon:yes stop_codon:yes gene_type:complete